MKRATQTGTLRQVVSTRMPTRWGVFRTLVFEREILNGTRRSETAIAIVLGDLTADLTDAPLLRVHSQCFTGEVLGSLRCDCGQQLEMAMRAIGSEGRGVVIYEYQEGRGIGLIAKLQAYALQDQGLDTVDANHALGFMTDYRDFGLPAAILRELGIDRVRLLTNNPLKTRALSEAGIEVVAQIPCEAAPNPHSLSYLRAKKERMGHSLTLESHEGVDSSLAVVNAEWAEASDAEKPNQFQFGTIETAISELRAGRMIVVVDDEDRENEGDLTMAAEKVTAEAINFMATHGRGLICLAMTGERLDELELPQMAPESTALGGTAFTVSIDVKGHDITTGISAHDRAETIKAAVDESSYPEDFARPGHVFPLRARAGGVLERRGQTEAAVDLTSLAGLYPAGVICEIVNDDGTMARVPDLFRFCEKHNLVMITVADLARHRFDSDYELSLGALDGLFPVCARRSAIRAQAGD